MRRKNKSIEVASHNRFSPELQAGAPCSSLASPFFTLVEFAPAKMLGAVALSINSTNVSPSQSPSLELDARVSRCSRVETSRLGVLGPVWEIYMWFPLFFSLLPSLPPFPYGIQGLAHGRVTITG